MIRCVTLLNYVWLEAKFDKKCYEHPFMVEQLRVL